jgi:hypothetical protein
MELGGGFPRVFQFPLPSIPSSATHSSSTIRGWSKEWSTYQADKWTQPHNTVQEKKKVQSYCIRHSAVYLYAECWKAEVGQLHRRGQAQFHLRRYAYRAEVFSDLGAELHLVNPCILYFPHSLNAVQIACCCSSLITCRPVFPQFWHFPQPVISCYHNRHRLCREHEQPLQLTKSIFLSLRLKQGKVVPVLN